MRDAEKGEGKLKRPGGRAGNLRRERSPQPFTPPSPVSAAQTTFVLFQMNAPCLLSYGLRLRSTCSHILKESHSWWWGILHFSKNRILYWAFQTNPPSKSHLLIINRLQQENCFNYPTTIDALILYSTLILLFNRYLQFKQYCSSVWCWRSIPTFRFCVWFWGFFFTKFLLKLLKIKFCGNLKQSHRECVCSSI